MLVCAAGILQCVLVGVGDVSCSAIMVCAAELWGCVLVGDNGACG